MVKHSIRLIMICGFLMCGVQGFAQNGTIKGNITDVNGVSLTGANDLIQGFTLGASTDKDGNFSIDDVPAGTYTVEAQFIGFITLAQTVSVASGRASTVNFQLQEDNVSSNS